MNSDGCVEKEELERVAKELSKLGEVNNDDDENDVENCNEHYDNDHHHETGDRRYHPTRLHRN